MENHRILFEMRSILKCITCGSVWEPKDYEKAEKHLLVPDALGPPGGTYNCLVEGCGRTFTSLQGLRVHEAKGHRGKKE